MWPPVSVRSLELPKQFSAVAEAALALSPDIASEFMDCSLCDDADHLQKHNSVSTRDPTVHGQRRPCGIKTVIGRTDG
jgi:hypothetical protein